MRRVVAAAGRPDLRSASDAGLIFEAHVAWGDAEDELLGVQRVLVVDHVVEELRRRGVGDSDVPFRAGCFVELVVDAWADGLQVRLVGDRHGLALAHMGGSRLLERPSCGRFASDRSSLSSSRTRATSPMRMSSGPTARFTSARPDQRITILAQWRPGRTDLFVLAMDLCPEH